jgi:PKD repeat protein
MNKFASVFRTAFLFFAVLSASSILQAQTGTAQTEVSGEASVIIVDRLDGTSELQYFIIDKKSRHETRIFFNVEADPAFKTGKHLKVLGRGRSDGKGINAENVLLLDGEADSAASEGSVSAPVAVPETRNVLTILVDFNDAYVDTGTSNGVSLQAAKDRMYNETKNVSDFFYNSSLTTLAIPADPDNEGVEDVFGHYQIDDSYIGGDSAQCTSSTWVSKASAAWEAANPGKDINLYRHRLLIVPTYWDWSNRHCGWGGVAQLGCGSWCWAIAADPRSILHGVIIHELGHNFGLHHASKDTNNDGVNDSEYGDSSDMMGGSRNWMKFNPPHFEDKGWMDNVEFEIRNVTPTSSIQSFDLIPVDEEAWDWPGLRALKVERSANSDYYVSFRQQTGDYNRVSSTYTNGLSLHYGKDGSARSFFIRMIAPGETFVDNAANVSITATSQATVTDGGNTVEVMGVEICDVACSQVPAPSNLSASAVSTDRIDLVWTDNSDSEDGFDLERSPDGSNWSTIASTLANSVDYVDSGLASATRYYYRVRALESGQYSGYSNVANTITLATPPSADFTYSAIYTEVTFTDASSDSDGTVVGWSWNFGDGSSSSVQNPVHTFTDAGTYNVSLSVTDNHGASDSTLQSITVDAPLFTNFYASSETTSGGTVSGNLNATRANDGTVESITERESGGKPANRHTWLEHLWNFTVSTGATVTLHANAWSGGSNDGDTFDFEYSLNNGSFKRLFNVNSSSDANLESAVIPGGGSIVIRVVDTDRTGTHREKNTVFVDHLFIQVSNPSSDPPDGDPSGLTAIAVSSSQIDLNWTDGTMNESGFTVEGSPDGTDGSWSPIADLPAGSESYSHAGLADETTYFYQVKAFNDFGETGYTPPVSATTDAASAIELSATKGKLKGKHSTRLDWSSASGSAMDVFDGVSLLTANVAGTTYTHNTDNKRAATYVYHICETDSPDTCSNEVTVVYRVLTRFKEGAPHYSANFFIVDCSSQSPLCLSPAGPVFLGCRRSVVFIGY